MSVDVMCLLKCCNNNKDGVCESKTYISLGTDKHGNFTCGMFNHNIKVGDVVRVIANYDDETDGFHDLTLNERYVVAAVKDDGIAITYYKNGERKEHLKYVEIEISE